MILSAQCVMKTDLLLIPVNAPWADRRADALAVENAGFDGLWTWDHPRDPTAPVEIAAPRAPELALNLLE